jgi:putative glutamine amidotransferase
MNAVPTSFPGPAPAVLDPTSRPLLIGISARIFYPGTAGIEPVGVWSKTVHYLEQSVALWLVRGGALPMMVPGVDARSELTRGDLRLSHYASALDGLVLQGGNDVAPESYGETALDPAWHGDAVRDRYERDLVAAFVAAGKPVFGICRGLQLLNVHFGGTLYQDIETQRPGAQPHRDSRYERNQHDVTFVPGSRLASLYRGAEDSIRHRINSIHHQAIKNLAPGFVVEATSPEDGLIEAVRWQGPSYVAAVQWHPEFHDPALEGDFDDGPLLHDFLSAARAVRDAAPAAASAVMP